MLLLCHGSNLGVFVLQIQVIVNRTEYQPTIAMNNKKSAKAAAATCCLQELGLVPRDAPK
jgi:hypothetical protein